MLSEPCSYMIKMLSDPTRWLVFSHAHGLWFEVFHKDVGERWGKGGSHGNAFYLLVEFVLEWEICVRHTMVDERWGGLFDVLFCFENPQEKTLGILLSNPFIFPIYFQIKNELIPSSIQYKITDLCWNRCKILPCCEIACAPLL